MSLSKYRAFLMAVETGSLTSAAKRLSCTQSVVSRMIADLEAFWNVTLLNRKKSGVTLTTAGWALLPYIRSVCNEERRLEGVVEEMAGLKQGVIRLGVMPAVANAWLPTVLKQFGERFPQMTFEVSVGNSQAINDWIEDGRVDVGLTVPPFAGSFNAQLIQMDELRVIFPHGHPLEALEKIPVTDLTHYSFLLHEQSWCREIQDAFDEMHQNVMVRFKTVGGSAILRCVQQGVGISVLPELFLRSEAVEVGSRPLDPPIWRRIYLVTKDIPTSPAVKEFVLTMPKLLFAEQKLTQAQ